VGEVVDLKMRVSLSGMPFFDSPVEVVVASTQLWPSEYPLNSENARTITR
jgi:hypothetical protein